MFSLIVAVATLSAAYSLCLYIMTQKDRYFIAMTVLLVFALGSSLVSLLT